MMIQELYRALLEQGASAQHHQGEVKLHLPKALDAALKQQLIARKDELKQYLLGLYASASQAPVIKPVERTQAHFPLSSAQQRLWFLDQLQGNTIAYNMSAAFTVSGEFDLAVLEQTMQSIVARHEVLRTRFIEVEGEGKQQLVSAPAQLVSSHDLSDLTASAQQTQLDALLAQEAAYAFDLSTDSLIRVHYVTLSPQQGVLMFNLHHIVSDGYSVALLVKEFSHTYSALIAGQEPELAPLPLHYIDYAHWQQNEARTHYQAQLDYWVKQLADAPEVHTLPVTGQRDTLQHPAQKFTQQLPEHQAKAIADSAEALQLSPFAFLHALLSLVVARHSHSQDIVIGTPVENRLQSGLQSLQGFFVNTVPLRVSTEFDTLMEYFEHVKSINQQALANQELPLDQLIEGLQISRSQVHAPLFQILLTVEGTPAQPVSTQFNVADVQLTQQVLPVTSSKFDLDINLVFNEQGLALNWVYDSHLFTADYITKLSTHLSQLIAALVPQNLASLSQQSPQQIDMLSEQERQHLVYDVQSETLAYNAELSLHEQISRQAQLTPDAIAIDMPGGRTLSYAQLDAGANRIAAYLQQHYSLSADSMVGVSTERHAEMVMAILAILKTGAAYLPLDPGYPSARLAQIIDDAKPVVTLTDNPAILQGLATDTLSLATLNDAAVSTPYQPVAHQGDNLAYAIYTSGSTGKPKGVAISHRNINALLSWADTVYSREDYARVLCSTSINFDLSAFELFFTLTRGGTCVLVDNALSLLTQPVEVSLINTVPSAIKALLEQTGIPAGVRVVNLAGEPLGRDVVNQLLRDGHCERVYNLYGPSEDTTYSTCACFTQEIDHAPGIGQVISNTQAFILNDQLALLPYGATGELYLGGDGLARGYLNQPELSAERFIDNPFYDPEVAGSSTRLYRTGDLVRYQADGTLAFVGRADDQVKIRGFRVELGEISEQLSRQAAIDSAVVLAKSGANGTYLVAYVQPTEALDEATHSDFISAALSELAGCLPDYMVPKLGRVIPHWPLTANGKINKKALPEVDPGALQDHYVAPQTDLEQAVCEIWAELLHLDATQISTTASFFALGGHSLLSVKLAAALRAQLAVELPLSTLFNATTVAEQAKAVAAAEGQTLREDIKALPRVMQDDPQLGQHRVAPLSYAQQRLWFIDQLEQGTPQYNMPAAFAVDGELDLTVVEAVLQTIIARHEVLRTVYRDDVQVIRQDAGFTLSYEDVRTLSETAQQQAIAGAMAQQLSQPFDLTREVMVRAGYIQTTERSGVLLFNMHHIASDGWSMQVLINEFTTLYQAYSQGEDNPLAPLSIQYADYAQWQRSHLNHEVLDTQLSYWQQQLADLPSVHSLPLDYPRPALKQHQGGQVKSTLSAQVAQGLSKLASAQGLTPFMLLHGALSLLLSRHSNARDIVIGTPVANRMQAELAPLIGFFVNTLVLNVNTDQPSLADYLAHVKAVHLGAQSHQDVPFEQLVEQLNVPRSSAYTPLFQVMLTTRTDYAVTEQVSNQGWSLGEAQLSPLAEDAVIAKFDLDIDLTLSDAGVEMCWTYDKALFSAARIETLSRHLGTLLTTLAQQAPATLLAHAPDTLAMLSAAEQHTLLLTLNDNALRYDTTQSIHGLFEQQVQRTPQATALIFNEQHISYEVLNQRANQLAHYLLSEHRVTPETPLGVCSSRSVEMVVSILAILKAGGAYVPLDPSYPASRLGYIAKDAGLTHILAYDAGLPVAQALMAEQGGSAVDIATLTLSAYAQHNPALTALGGDKLAYAIYTSGSTGQPKGVAISHRNVNALLSWADTEYSGEDYARMLCSTSINFDLSAFELFLPLTRGGSCVLVDSALSLLTTPVEVTLINTVPSAIKALLEQGGIPAGVRVVNLAGEPLGRDVVNQLLAGEHCERVYNLYGPSEDTTYSTCARFTQPLDEAPSIGRVINNSQAFILNDKLALLPYGTTGELYLGGDGLARGYLNQPQLSAERFIDNPFYDAKVAGSSKRLYRTGDLVRYQADGNLAFVGRADDQVKIRGFRVELGEISEQLSRQAAIDSAVVLAKSGANGLYLVAYIHPTQTLDEAEHTDFITAALTSLAACLPEYMVPRLGQVVPEWPLTASGKINKKALPEVDATALQGRYVAPQTDTEQAVCEIWAQLLNVEAGQISTQTDFFELGGHSLLVVKLAAALRAELSVELPVKTLFNVTTLAEQAKAVEAHQGQAIRAEITAQPRVMLADPQLGQHSLQPLSFAQQRLWFIDQLNQGSAQYNMPAAFHVQGELNLTVVEAVLQTIVDRHEVLRTVYRDDAQVIRQQASFELSYEDVRMLSETAQQQAIAGAMTQQLSQPFDLSCEVMMRAGYIQTSQSSGVLLFNMHHIASDGWSMQVLIKEFAALYLAYSQGQENPLAPLTIQYADYAQWQRTYLEDGVLDEQLGYWQKQLAQLPAVHSLPLDHPRPDVKQHQGGQVKTTLSTEVAQGLAALAKAQGLTPFMLLHGALSLLLSRHSNAQDIVIGTPVANRMQAELAPLIGFFVNTLVLNVNTAQATLADYLAHVKAVHLDAQSNQDVPFEQLVEQLNVPRSSAYTPLFQVMLTTTTDYGVTDQSIDNNWSLGDAQLSPLDDDAVIAKFDLDIDMALSDTGVDICWTYDKALFSQERIETLSRHLCTLLTTLAQQTTEILLAQAPGALTMLSGAEQHELLVTFNQQVESFDATQCIHTLFEQQALATPDATALVFEEQHISYGALNQRANQLAHYLLNECQLTPETLVGVCSSRSVEMVVNILAILKAGAAYVPLDPSYPNSRLSHMASDAKLQHILGYDTGLSVAAGLMTELGGRAIDIASLDLCGYPQDNPAQVEVSGNNLAYVIYTSGSTGKPKGVAVEHSSLVNYQCHCRTQYELTAEDVMLQFSTMSFDIFVEELFGALCQGASLVLRNEECLGSAAAFNAFCSAHQVTVMSLPTAFWKQMTDMEGAFAIATLRAVIIGGEAMGQTHMERFFSAAPTVTLFNSYGPTEATITATTSRLHAASSTEFVTIGKANVNNTLLVLNEDGGLVPKGSEGELYIGGPGVARGYLNQPQLSAERFISNPYADQCLAIEAPRLYRTGDLVRYTDQGELIFIGRNDDQVKLRGFRVELGELSGILAQQPQVQDAAVTVFKVDTEQHLAAYLKLHASDSEADPQDTLQAIRNQLAEQLPQYMQPGSLNIVDELPLTVNGKLDVAALPEPKLNMQQSEYCAPTTELEHQLVAIWAQLLSREAQDIGVTTSFFNLGGHSLLILKAVSQIQTQFEVSLTVQTIFENDTVATLAAQIERQRNQQALKQQINDASADQIERVEF